MTVLYVILIAITYIVPPFIIIKMWQLIHYPSKYKEQLVNYYEKLERYKERSSYWNKPDKQEYIDKALKDSSMFRHDDDSYVFFIAFWPIFAIIYVFYYSFKFLCIPFNYLEALVLKKINNKAEKQIKEELYKEDEKNKLKLVSKLLREGEEYESEKIQLILKSINYAD